MTAIRNLKLGPMFDEAANIGKMLAGLKQEDS